MTGAQAYGAAEPPALALGYHFLAAVDIEGFSRLDPLQQVTIQGELSGVLEAAAKVSGLNREHWEIQVTGDGELAVLPPGIDGPRLLTDYPRALRRALAAVNGPRRPTGRRLRIRLALHHGPVAAGRLGPAGTAPIVISRLLDAEALRDELRNRTREDLVLIVSEPLYNDVIKSRFRGLDPAHFHPIEQETKGVSYTGYVHRPATKSTTPPRAGPPRSRTVAKIPLPQRLRMWPVAQHRLNGD